MKKYKKFWIIIIFFLALFIFITVIQSFTKSDFIKKFGNFFSNNTKLIIKKQIRKFIISNKSNFIFTKNFSKNFDNTNFVITSFKNKYLKSMGPRAYFAKDSVNLFLMTGTGTLMYKNILNKDGKKKIKFKTISTNFKNFANPIKNESEIIVKDALIKDNKIYISYMNRENKECFYNSILVGNLNTKKIFFKKFFSNNFCQNYNSYSVGGNLSDYEDNSILLAIGDWASYEKFGNNNPQKLDNLIGKIISININTKKHKILSIGHRNQQGLFYDKENDIIFSTDHGPLGGDEINLNYKPGFNNIKNYGWAISSYGDHYKNLDQKALYKIAPLYKSHKDYGFVEPLKWFTPAIGISQIIKNEKLLNLKNKNVIYVGALGTFLEEGDLSIHQFILNSNFEIENHTILPIGERVRDMIYIEELNKIFVYLETSPSVAIIEKLY